MHLIKISVSPVQELIIHEVVEVDYNDLLRERITPAGNMPLYWCDSILFSFSSLPMSDEVVKDYMNGKIHWMEVHYTPMNNYIPILELVDNDLKSTFKIRNIDTSKSKLHKEFIKWLKSRKE